VVIIHVYATTRGLVEKMSEYSIVVCVWNDAVSFRNTDLQEIGDEKGVLRITIGLLRRDTKDYVLIQSDADPRNMSEMTHCIKIPKSLIVQLRKTSTLEINEIIKGGD